jgi:hypothetical protein
MTLLNFCDEIAGEYLDGILDRRIADKNVAYVAESVWETVVDFVKWFSDYADQPRAWDQLREFSATWKLPPSALEAAPSPPE